MEAPDWKGFGTIMAVLCVLAALGLFSLFHLLALVVVHVRVCW